MSLINVSNLTFSYEGSYDDIFTDVSFQIDTAWKLGFCGRNGRGKTTFLKLLMGEFEYRGSISSSVKFDYFPFPVVDKTLDTMSILTTIAPETPAWQIQKEISLLDITEDALYRPFQTLSNGEQTKSLLAGLFLRGENFLLIDEPTNHLDMSGRETVADYLNRKSGFIVVSHDRSFLDTCVDHILSINKANIEVIKGNFSTWIENKERQDNFELAENEKLKKDVKRLQLAAKQSEDWSSKAESAKMGKGAAKARKKGNDGIDMMAYNAEKSRRMQQRRKNLERRQQSAIEDKSKLLKNLETADDLKIFPLTYHTSRLITVEGLEVTYDNNNHSDCKKIINDLSFSLMQGDRIALRGSNGSGKSSLLKLICGEDIPHTGLITIGSKLVISYVPQDTSFLAGDLKSHTEKYQIDETLFKSILRKLDFSRIQFGKDMRDFSAGQKKKVLLATSLCQQAHAYIWDEPLNYIDVLSRIQIEDLILKYQPTLLFVEHDRTFCEKIATITINL